MSASRLEALKQTLRLERAGLLRERDQKIRDIEDLNKAITTIDQVLGDGASAGTATNKPKQLTLGESENARVMREREQLRRAIIEVLKANPAGLPSEVLCEKVAPSVQTAAPVSPHRVSLLCRQLREKGLGIAGEPGLWLYVPSENEQAEFEFGPEAEDEEAEAEAEPTPEPEPEPEPTPEPTPEPEA